MGSSAKHIFSKNNASLGAIALTECLDLAGSRRRCSIDMAILVIESVGGTTVRVMKKIGCGLRPVGIVGERQAIWISVHFHV